MNQQQLHELFYSEDMKEIRLKYYREAYEMGKFNEYAELAKRRDHEEYLWDELKNKFSSYLKLIAKDLHKDRDGDLSISRNYYGWGEMDNGWVIVHNGYVNDFSIEGESLLDALNKAISRVDEMIKEEQEDIWKN